MRLRHRSALVRADVSTLAAGEDIGLGLGNPALNDLAAIDVEPSGAAGAGPTAIIRQPSM